MDQCNLPDPVQEDINVLQREIQNYAIVSLIWKRDKGIKAGSRKELNK